VRVVAITRHFAAPLAGARAARTLRCGLGMNRNVALGVVGAVASGLTGCSYQLVSPPARMVNLESAKTVAPGETMAGLHGAGYATIFDPGAVVTNASVRRGVADNLEVDGDLSWARVTYDGFPDIDRNIYAARAGAKMSNDRGSVALFGGLGGGFAPAAGGFTAADLGFAFSFPNCYVVPFANAMMFGSLPLGARQVDFRNADGSIVSSDKADPTYGFGFGTGIEIPLSHDRCRAGQSSPRLQLGGALDLLIPSDGPIVTRTTTESDGTTTTTTESRGGRHGMVGLAVGIEVPF